MRQRNNGFVKFMKKLDGRTTEDDNILETKGPWSGVYQRYECLLELLSGEYCWGAYMDRVVQLSRTERRACRELRNHLGLHVPSLSVGVYIEDRRFLEQAVEYIRSHHEGEQQDEVSGEADSSVTVGYTYDFNPVGSDAWSAHERLVDLAREEL